MSRFCRDGRANYVVITADCQIATKMQNQLGAVTMDGRRLSSVVRVNLVVRSR